MKDLLGGLFLIAIAATLIAVGLHMGHDNHATLALVPFGAFCGVAGGFLISNARL